MLNAETTIVSASRLRPGLPPASLRRNARGFSLVELIIVVVIILIVAAMGVPKALSIASNLRITGDASDLNGAIILAKMRASSNFSRARLYADLSANTFRVEWQKSGTATWTSEGGTQSLSSGISFGFGTLSSPPSGTQASLAQAPLCSGTASTACITFNSRGIPIDSSAAPTANDAIYVTDGKAVTGVTISATGSTAVWRSPASTTAWLQR